MECTKLTNKYGILSSHPDYDRIRGPVYRALHKDRILEYQREYRKSWDGWLTLTYAHMRRASKERGHPMPTFTKQELWRWMWDTRRAAHFVRMHKNWLAKDCKKWLKPSLDRVDNSIGYTLDNLTLTTWKKNAERGLKNLKRIRKALGYNVKS